jgi:hypothetical protein
MMSAILRGFPQVQIAAYDVNFPGTWHDYVQRVVNGIANASQNSVQIDFWSGLTSVTGYSAIRLYDADFYKATQTDADWDTALRYEYSHLASVLSKRFANWGYVSRRFYESPFSWIDGDVANEGAFTAPRSPNYVRGQLLAFRTWGMGGEFANYAYAPLSDFDYRPFLGALRDASRGGNITTSPPTLNVSTATAQPGCRATIAGAASDPLAVWAVNWRTNAAHGSAQLTPQSSVVGASTTAAVSWVADGVSLQPGINDVTVTAIDIKGLTRHVTSRVRCPS